MKPLEEQKTHSLKPVLIIAALIGLVVLIILTNKLQEKEIDQSKVIKYTLQKEEFKAQVEQMVDKYKVRDDGDIAVIHPAPGSDVYIPSGNLGWGSILELEKGETYRLHVASVDQAMHAIWIDRLNISQKLRKGKVYIIELTPKKIGEYSIICRQFCGAQHYGMVGKIIVVDTK